MRESKFVDQGIEFLLDYTPHVPNAPELLEAGLRETYRDFAGWFGISEKKAKKLYASYYTGLMIGRAEGANAVVSEARLRAS